MKTLIVSLLLVVGTLGAQAGGYHGYYGGHYGGYYHGYYGHGSSVSIYWGAPFYWPAYSYGFYPAYPAYWSYPPYGYDYSYARPNYAIGGTLAGALAGGLIGNSIHHQGWEGAGIGAAAGLLLGSLAEHSARTYERSCNPAPRVSYVQPNYIADARSVQDPPAAPAAPPVEAPRATGYASRPTGGTMGSANSLFGR